MISSTGPAPRTALAGGALVLAAALLLPACSRMTVRTHADPEANFSAYSTFAFAPHGGNQHRASQVPRRLRAVNDPLFRAHVQEAITEALGAEGLTLTRERRAADLIVAYRTVVKDQADVVPPVYGVGWRGRAYMARPGHVRWYKEGTLVVDVIDARSDHLVWRGIGVGAMRDMRPGPDLKAAVGEILDRFPPE